MKIAVPIRLNGHVDDHFGHCEYYGVYSVSDANQIENVETIPSVNGCGCKSNIASDLAALGVEVMLAGGIGAGAINVLNHSGISVVRGCSGNAEENVKLFLDGKLVDSGESCPHHEHHHGMGHGHFNS